MRQFLKKFAIFTALISCICLLYFFAIGRTLNNDRLYKVPPGTSRLILGDSHTTCLSDSLMDSTMNLSQPADAYVYSYGKLQKILPNNPQVHTVLLSCSEIVVVQKQIAFWFDNSFMSEKIHRYFHFLTPGQLSYLFRQNPTQVTKDVCHIPIAKTGFCATILRSPHMSIRDLDLGGYVNVRRQVDVNKAFEEFAINEKGEVGPLSEFQVEYLRKIADLCKSYKVELVLLRTPEYQYSTHTKKSEPAFQNLIRTRFSDVHFIDLINMDLPASCFYDLEHVNYFGEKRLADTINLLLRQIPR